MFVAESLLNKYIQSVSVYAVFIPNNCSLAVNI